MLVEDGGECSRSMDEVALQLLGKDRSLTSRGDDWTPPSFTSFISFLD